MELTIKAQPRHVQLSPRLRAHVEAKMTQALAHVQASGPVHVDVALRRAPHASGGAHHKCRVMVTVPHAPAVVVREVDQDMYRAIDHSQQRLHVALLRRSGRQHNAASRPGHGGRVPTGGGRKGKPTWQQEEALFLRSQRRRPAIT